MSKWWRFNLHGHLALLPFTLGYAVFCFVVYGARSWGWRNGVVIAIGGESNGQTKIWGRPGAQTLGACQVYADSVQIARAELHVHETCHVVQQMCGALIGQVVVPIVVVLAGGSTHAALWACVLGGPIGAAGYAVAYGALFFVAWASRGFGPWHDAYHANAFENQAYARQARWLEMTREERAGVWS